MALGSDWSRNVPLVNDIGIHLDDRDVDASRLSLDLSQEEFLGKGFAWKLHGPTVSALPKAPS